MPIQVRPLRLQQGITTQRVGNEILLYDERRHQAFCLNPTSACVWDHCDGEHTIAQLAAAATRSLDASIGEDLVSLALEDFRRDGLLETEVKPMPNPEVSRRAMMQSLGASAILLVPVVAVVLAPKAAQAYGGCFDCTNATQVQNRAAHKKVAVAADNLRRSSEAASKANSIPQ